MVLKLIYSIKFANNKPSPDKKTSRNLLETSAQPYIISKLHVVFNGCAEVPSKLREVFLLGQLPIYCIPFNFKC